MVVDSSANSGRSKSKGLSIEKEEKRISETLVPKVSYSGEEEVLPKSKSLYQRRLEASRGKMPEALSVHVKPHEEVHEEREQERERRYQVVKKHWATLRHLPLEEQRKRVKELLTKPEGSEQDLTKAQAERLFRKGIQEQKTAKLQEPQQTKSQAARLSSVRILPRYFSIEEAVHRKLEAMKKASRGRLVV